MNHDSAKCYPVVIRGLYLRTGEGVEKITGRYTKGIKP